MAENIIAFVIFLLVSIVMMMYHGYLKKKYYK